MCAWSTPQLWATAQIVTAADLNNDVRGNARYLKGLDGLVTIEDALLIATANGKYLQVPSMATANLPGTPAAGMIVYDSTTATFKRYENGGWRDYLAAAEAPVTVGSASTAENNGVILTTLAAIGGILHFLGTFRLNSGTLTLRFYNPSVALITAYGIVLITNQVTVSKQVQTINGTSIVITNSGGTGDIGTFHAFLKPAAIGAYKMTAQYSASDAAHECVSMASWNI